MYLLAVLFVIPLTINKLLFLIESVLTLTKFLLKYYIGDKGELSGLSWQSLSILEHFDHDQEDWKSYSERLGHYLSWQFIPQIVNIWY